MERYEISVAGLARGSVTGDGAFVFPGCRVILEEETGENGALSLRAELERGGSALTELLRRLLESGARILSCARRETSLQEVFDLVASETPGAAGRERPGDGDTPGKAGA